MSSPDLPARPPRHCRHCAGDCPGDCLLGDGQCSHGWDTRPPRQFGWPVLLTRRWWDRVLWGQHGRRG
ncbi:MAG TPA: hypothetical protein VGD91_31720 [Trebonia sp.]